MTSVLPKPSMSRAPKLLPSPYCFPQCVFVSSLRICESVKLRFSKIGRKTGPSRVLILAWFARAMILQIPLSYTPRKNHDLANTAIVWIVVQTMLHIGFEKFAKKGAQVADTESQLTVPCTWKWVRICQIIRASTVHAIPYYTIIWFAEPCRNRQTCQHILARIHEQPVRDIKRSCRREEEAEGRERED